MKTNARLAAWAVPLALLTSCGSETAGAELAKLTRTDLPVIWPQDGNKVYSTFDFVVGSEPLRVDGAIAVISGGGPVPAGTTVSEGGNIQLLPTGQNYGELELEPGQRTLTVQLLDEAGRSLGPDYAHQVTYEVVPAPPVRRVLWVEPKDGATVPPRFKVVFGVEGMGMSPAGQNMADKTVGHHHVLINEGPTWASRMVPADATHIHYGKAQTEAELELAPGEYDLTLQFADGGHRSYGERMAATITVTVEDDQ